MRIRIRISLEVKVGESLAHPMVEVEEEVPPDKDYKTFYLELYQQANFMFWKTLLEIEKTHNNIIAKGITPASQEQVIK